MSETVTVVERMARAIVCALGPEYGPPVETISISVALAALEALRVPSEGMVEASNREWDGRMSHRSSGAWTAMIDAAISEYKGE